MVAGTSTLHHFFAKSCMFNVGECYSFSPVQRIITTEKGVVIDFDSISNDSKGQSKELYTWGQSEAEDIKDGLS